MMNAVSESPSTITRLVQDTGARPIVLSCTGVEIKRATVGLDAIGIRSCGLPAEVHMELGTNRAHATTYSLPQSLLRPNFVN